jgi:DNA repair protein SbcD/Mre11
MSQLDWFPPDHPEAARRRKTAAVKPWPLLRLLCAGDLHIGRRPTRLPEHVDCRPFSAAECWRSIVDCALEQQVDAVLLSGDVVDRANRYFEAFGPLESGLRQLSAAGIRTVAVAGNHDFDVLPRLADSLGPRALRVLGRGGRWERLALEKQGAPALWIDGWSFPSEHFPVDPLAAYDLPPTTGLPVIGMLHGDLDVAGSRYAPVSSTALRANPAGFWLLGHLHQPVLDECPGAAALLYPGSPQALDPGETGAHGAWIVEIEHGRRFTARMVPLSAVRYETLRVELDGAVDADEVENRITAAVRGRLEEIVEDAGPLRYLSLRLRLVGRSAAHRSIAARVPSMIQDLQVTKGDACAVVERAMVETRPAVDLAALAGGSDPPAVLARLLLMLDGPAETDEAVGALLMRAERRAQEVRGARAYLQVGAPQSDWAAGGEDAAAETAVILRRQAGLLLDELLAQKEA